MASVFSAASLAAVLGTASCSLPEGDFFGQVASKPDPSTIRFCNSGEPEFVDPALVTSTTGSPLMRLMFAGLADYGPDIEGTSIPSLAESWEISADQRTFTFKLREGIKWSNGKPITASDFVYHVSRILHPATLSRNNEPLKPVKNAELFNSNRVKVLMADSPPFKKGDIVQVIGEGDKELDAAAIAKLPNSNYRKSSKEIFLRDLGADKSEAYATVPAGEEVDLVELGGPNNEWAYVFWRSGSWFYGWTEVKDLDIQPAAEAKYLVRDIRPEHRPGVMWSPDPTMKLRTGTVVGSKLLMLPDVLGVSAPDPRTFIVETWGPTPYLADDMKSRPFRPTYRDSVSRSPQKWTKPEEGLLVTSGPYVMTAWHERDKMIFEKSPTFFAADEVKTERWISYNMNDQAASSNLYFQGGCDAVTSNNIPYSYLPAISGAKRGGKAYKDFILAPYLGIYYYMINTEKFPNVHLRRALSFGVDRSPIPNLLHGGENPTSAFMPGRAISTLTDAELKQCGITRETKGVATFVTPEHCYIPPQGPDFDIEQAKKELAIAKKEMGADFPKTIELKFNSGVDSHKIIAEYFQDQWKRNLGLDIKLQVQEWKTYLKDTTNGDYQIGRLGWIGSTPDPESQFLVVFKCSDGKPSGFNRSRWCNDEFDRLYKEAGATLDRGERLRILRKAEKLMIEQSPIIPIYVYTQKHLRKPYLRDYPLQLGDNTAMWRAWIDPNWKNNASKDKQEAVQ